MGGYGHGNWANNWRGHCIPPYHHGWYHGCWSGHWGNYWYAPVAFGATVWGLNAILPSWGYSYGYSYSNPYYVESAAPAYDYSEPIVINNYNMPAADASAESTSDAAPPAESPETTEAYQLFDQALAAFKKGDYKNALQVDQQALRKSPQDPVMHEVSALCMFALGDYSGAAAVLNNLLSVAPGMDWTTLSGLYGSVDAYTGQLRALEAHCKAKPSDAAALFVLAYHYLVAGHEEEAVAELKRVVAAKPEDQVAKRMLAAMAPPAESSAEPAKPDQPADAPPASTGPTTDLVGSWQAERDGDTFELSIDENSQFTWKATPTGKPTVTLTGTMSVANDGILLQSKDQGTMAAQVTSGGADQFQFIAAGSPPDDKGLSFQRVKQKG
jgi:Flp pilus assembly protein TadD